MSHLPTSNLAIYTCGGLEIRLNDAPLTGLASRKAEALLIYIACEPRPHPRDVLADMLWDDATIDRARGNLSVLLTSLRQQLGAYLAINRQTVSFVTTQPYTLDYATLHAAIDAAEGRTVNRSAMAELATALELYRGDFLQGFALRDSSGFEAWALAAQERLRRRVVEAYAQLTEAALVFNDTTAGIVHANALLALEPFHEATHSRLLLLLARSGQRAAALDHYENYCRLLDEQLGVAPSLEVTDLYRRIWRGDLTPVAALPPAAASVAPRLRGAPFTPTSLIGRSDALEQIGARLARPDCRLLTLLGPGGIGKSRLGVAAALAYVGGFRDDGAYVALAARDATSDLAGAIAEAVGLELRGNAPAAAQLCTFLAGRELLLVLDNAEHLDSVADLANRILAAAPAVRLLVTSREPLALQAEWIFDVAGLDYPAPSRRTPEELAAYPAVHLFIERAQRLRSDITLDTLTAPAVAQICALCEGLPLAIELAAGQVRQLSVPAIAAAIAADLAVLTSELRDLPPRQRSIRATFGASLARLTPIDRQTYLQLSCFAGSFSTSAASTICNATDAQLDRFVERSLLRRTAGDRYELHALLRQFAGAELRTLEPAAVVSALLARHSALYLDQAGALVAGFQRTPQAAARHLQPDLANLRAAWQYALTNAQIEQLAHSSSGLIAFCDLTGQFVEGERLLGATAEQAASHSGRAGARLLIGHALFLHRLSRYNEAVAQAMAALTLAQQAGARDLEIAARARHGDSLQRLGALDDAVVTLRTALELAQQAELPALECEALSYLGFIAREQGAYEAAQAHYSAALELAGTLGHTWERCRLLNHLGGVAEYQGRFAAARTYWEEGLALAENLGARWLVGCIRGNLGNLDRNSGHYAAARANYTAAQAMYHAVGDLLGESIIVFSDGNVLADAGAFNAALERYATAADMATSCGDRLGQGLTLIMRGRVLLRMGDPASGRSTTEAGLSIVRDLGARRFTALALEICGQIDQRAGVIEPAVAAYAEALAIYADLGETHRRGEALIGRCECALALGDTPLAATTFATLTSLLDAPGAESDALHRPPALYWRTAAVAQQIAPEHAAELQRTARNLLGQRAAAIGDPVLATSFLNLPEHRAMRTDQ
jgi:predicted ATPase/DNA-binding SARP family transcriptional activator